MKVISNFEWSTQLIFVCQHPTLFFVESFERVKVNYGLRLRLARFAHCNFCHKVRLTLTKYREYWNSLRLKRNLLSSSFLVDKAKKTFESKWPRESYWERLLTSRNFEDSSEIVSVVSQDINCMDLIRFINAKYRTAFRSRSLLRTLHAK